MKGFKSDAERKAAFVRMTGVDGYFKKVAKYDSVKDFKGDDAIFSVPPEVMRQFYDPWAIQPQTSFLMMYPDLGIGPMNLTSRKPKEQIKYAEM